MSIQILLSIEFELKRLVDFQLLFEAALVALKMRNQKSIELAVGRKKIICYTSIQTCLVIINGMNGFRTIFI